jgi:hypothetical protein
MNVNNIVNKFFLPFYNIPPKKHIIIHENRAALRQAAPGHQNKRINKCLFQEQISSQLGNDTKEIAQPYF